MKKWAVSVLILFWTLPLYSLTLSNGTFLLANKTDAQWQGTIYLYQGINEQLESIPIRIESKATISIELKKHNGYVRLYGDGEFSTDDLAVLMPHSKSTITSTESQMHYGIVCSKSLKLILVPDDFVTTPMNITITKYDPEGNLVETEIVGFGPKIIIFTGYITIDAPDYFYVGVDDDYVD